MQDTNENWNNKGDRIDRLERRVFELEQALIDTIRKRVQSEYPKSRAQSEYPKPIEEPCTNTEEDGPFWIMKDVFGIEKVVAVGHYRFFALETAREYTKTHGGKLSVRDCKGNIIAKFGVDQQG